MGRAHQGHVRLCQTSAGADCSFPPAAEAQIWSVEAVYHILLQRIPEDRRSCIRNLDVREDERMDAELPDFGKCLAELCWSAQAWIGLVLRVSSIDPPHVPAKDFKRGYVIFLRI